MPTQSLFAKWSLWLRHAAPVLLLVTLSLIAGCQGGCSGESQHGYTEAVPDFYMAHLEANNAIWYHPNNGYSHNPGELTIAGLPSGSAVTELVAIAPERFIGLTTLYMVSSSASSLVIATAPEPYGPFSVANTVKTGANPFGLAMDEFARFAYVTNTGGDSVTVIDLLLNQAVATIALPPGSQPRGVAATPDGKKLYAAHFNTGVVNAIDAATRLITATIPLPAGSNPNRLAISPNGKDLYVTSTGSALTVAWIDVLSDTVSSLYLGASNAQGVAIDPPGTSLFIGNAGTAASAVSLFAPSTLAAAPALSKSINDENTFPAATGAGLAYLLSFAEGAFLTADQGAGTVTGNWKDSDIRESALKYTWPVGAKPSALALIRQARPCAVSTHSLDANGGQDASAGSIAANPAPNAAHGFYTCGTTVTFTATPANGLPFLGWSGDLTGTQNPPTLKVDRSVSVNATFGIASLPVPAWSITNTHSGNFTQDQNGTAYTIRVSNSGTAPTTVGQLVRVSDILPAGLTAVSMQGTGWECAVTPTIGCNRFDSLAAGASYPPITLFVNVAGNAPASVTNQATVAGGGVAASASATDPTTIVANGPPAWTITKTHSGNFIQGQNGAVYTITVSNTGVTPTSIKGDLVQVDDTLPTGLTAVSIQGSGWSCLRLTDCIRGDSLAPGASYPPITFTVNVAADAPAGVTNQATVDGGGVAAPASATDATRIIPKGAPAWTVTKTHSGNFTQGQNGAVYTITVSNVGVIPTTERETVGVLDTLPSGLTAVSIQGFGWNCLIEPQISLISCSRADSLAAGATYPPITLTVNVAANAPASVTNQATVEGGGVADQASATDPTTIGANATPAAWTITKTHSGNFKQGQNGAVYTITARNTGSGPTTAGLIAQVSDTLPAGLTAVSMQGSGWICAVTPVIGCNRSDSLSAGASYPPITLTVNVAANAGASVTNQVSASGGGVTGTASATDPTTIGANATPAAWTVTKTHSGNFKQGQNGAVYTITASNTGGGPTTGGVLAYVFDTLPTGLTAVSLQGSGWICGISSLPIGCNRGDSLAAGASYPPITRTVNVAANAAASVTNQVSAGGGGVKSDANAADPTTIGATAAPAWTITKTHSGNFTQGQK